MTTDKLTNALIAILDASKPDASITVVDARTLSEIDLPTIAVSVESAERHSLAIPGVMKCQVEITLRAHSGDDDDRATLTTWADEIEQLINAPDTIRDGITNSGLGLQCYLFKLDGGTTKWEETTFEAGFSAEGWIVRTS
jgi:hypothetical protein